MKSTKHHSANFIRRELLVRISHVLGTLKSSETNISLAKFIKVSNSTVSKLINYNQNYNPNVFPIASIDRLISISEKLRIGYTFTIRSKNGQTVQEFKASTVTDWGKVNLHGVKQEMKKVLE